MHRQEDNYFQLTHAPFRPQHQQPRKESLINRRQQNSAIPFQPLELPPLSQLLPSTTNEATAAAATAAVPPPPSQIDLIQPYNTNDISQFINDPDAAAVAAMAAANVNINRNHMYAYHPMTIIPPTQPQETAAIHEKERPRQPSNSSQLSNSTEKRYSFVTIPGVNQKKRPRRRYDEIERLYHCNWPNCTKSYGTLNHLNAHVSMQKHGPKRQPSEFREMRKEWRRQKKERDMQRKRQQEHFYHQPSPSFQFQPSPMPFY